MARKVFVSYKHKDTLVASLPHVPPHLYTTGRDYVDVIISKLENVEIYKGEAGDNDLSRFKDTTIRTHLKEKIRDSSVTVVLVTKGMREPRDESEQWIPWEVKYSLRRVAYGEKRSNSNGLLAVIVPDETGSYEWYLKPVGCVHCNTVTHQVDALFEILRKNMLNRKHKVTTHCNEHGSSFHQGYDHSYIHPVKWHQFINQPSHYIDIALNLRDNIDLF